MGKARHNETRSHSLLCASPCLSSWKIEWEETKCKGLEWTGSQVTLMPSPDHYSLLWSVLLCWS
jgi:hypothetical protein